jgi:hypothetical protein
MRKVYIEAKVKIILSVDEESDEEEVVSSLRCVADSDDADVQDFEILEWDITDSK